MCTKQLKTENAVIYWKASDDYEACLSVTFGSRFEFFLEQLL